MVNSDIQQALCRVGDSLLEFFEGGNQPRFLISVVGLASFDGGDSVNLF